MFHHHTVPSQSPLPWWGGRERQEVPSPLLFPQLREQGLSWKEKVKQGHGEAHPGRQVLSVVPEELQQDKREIQVRRSGLNHNPLSVFEDDGDAS